MTFIMSFPLAPFICSLPATTLTPVKCQARKGGGSGWKRTNLHGNVDGKRWYSFGNRENFQIQFGDIFLSPPSLTQPLRAHKHLYPTHPLHRQVNCLARHRAWQSGTRRVPTPRGRFVLPSLAPCLSRSPTAVVAGCGGGGGDDDVGTAAAMLLRMLLTEIGAHRRRLVVGVAARDARRSPSFDWRWGSR